MKAILKFNLDDREDELAHKRCVKAKEMAVAIWEVLHNNKRLTDEQVIQKMYDTLNEINVEELID